MSIQDNAKLLEQLKLAFERIIIWNNYEPKVTTKIPNQYLDFLIEPSFQGVNRFFVISFENKVDRTLNRKYYIPT